MRNLASASSVPVLADGLIHFPLFRYRESRIGGGNAVGEVQKTTFSDDR
jgi:hypothetical protein